ncbi:MAG: NAD(P)/FAD-dependent oxidoreductase [Clostridia bacterium]|nr:NAD(P)/FAD-dependent oxidoreductase [Clostridia bacterium]
MLVIGGGAAGMLAALIGARQGATVTILERNEKLGKKLYITGKGRCNITNSCPKEDFFKNVTNNPRFIMSALNTFSSEDTINLFEQLRVPLVIERGNRVFPSSNKSSDIINALLRELVREGVEVKYSTRVKSIYKDGNEFVVITDNGAYRSMTVVLATGGVTYKATGSTGDGYEFAKTFGHSIVPLKGSLIGVITDNTSALSGLTLKNVGVTAVLNDKCIASEFGELLFTHIGLSGPTILSLSSLINRFATDNLYIKIDLKPALDNLALDKRVLRDFTANVNKKLVNSLDELLPKSLIAEVIKQSGLSGDIVVNQMTKEQRTALIDTLKGLKYKIKAFDDINNAIITSGGICVKEINPKTMESKLVKGLYFAGEIIDVDAFTGGFNLQIALSTGYVAGESAAYAENTNEVEL